jgi:hypothetical protein
LSDDDSNGNGIGSITIYIDRNAFRVPKRAVTGSELRELAIPPIGADYDLFQVSAGSEPDLVVNDQEVVELIPEAHFFSAPRTIMAGNGMTSTSIWRSRR